MSESQIGWTLIGLALIGFIWVFYTFISDGKKEKRNKK